MDQVDVIRDPEGLENRQVVRDWRWQPPKDSRQHLVWFVTNRAELQAAPGTADTGGRESARRSGGDLSYGVVLIPVPAGRAPGANCLVDVEEEI